MEELVNALQEYAFEILLTVILPFIANALIALTKKWLAELEASKPKLADYLAQAVDIGVFAAEQLGIEELVDDKLQYAVNVAQAFLSEHGWDEIDIELLVAAIEAEVLKQFPK